jgi:hypothetical protein
MLAASVAFVLVNRRAGLGYFDGSEYALHIEGGGIAHAPGYPLFTLLGRCLHSLGADGFLAQQLISAASLVITVLALYRTWALEVSTRRAGFAAAFAVATASIAASYYLRLFAILPEVFDLNVALMALTIMAVTGFHYSKQPIWLGALCFMFGLGLCHHHTLAFLVPGCFWVVARRARQLQLLRSSGYAAGGFALGCLPLIYLFTTRNQVGVTYLHVHDLDSLLFVLLRKGYGTFHLSPLKETADVSALLQLAFTGLAQNYHDWGLLVFVPLLPVILCPLSAPLAHSTNFSVPDTSRVNRQYAWSSPSLVVAGTALLVFFLLFIPNCNLQLNVRSYQTIFLRFLTIPCLLLTYGIFKAALHTWDWASQWGRAGQIGAPCAMVGALVLPALASDQGLRYRHCDVLDEHVHLGFASIKQYTNPIPSPVDPSRGKCAIFAQGDTLLMGIKYYNHVVAQQKCFVFSQTSLTGQFLDRSEIQLAASVLHVEPRAIEAGDFATHPEALLNVFLQLDKLGYGLFVFSVTDFTEYFGKMFVKSPFAYRPVGNILQVVTESSTSFGMDQMYRSYQDYVSSLENYLQNLQRHELPNIVVDSQANQVLILNLADYAKFARLYPDTPAAISTLMRRAQAVEQQWLKLFPRER